MKSYRLSGLLIVGLLMIPGVVRAGEADPTAYLGVSIHYEAIRLALLGDSMEGVAEQFCQWTDIDPDRDVIRGYLGGK